MTIFNDFFGEEITNQMTKGLDNIFFNKFLNKNESKKRKPEEEMNGFMSEDNIRSNNFVNHRCESNSYETPSKRLRIDLEVRPDMTSDLNSNYPKSGFLKNFKPIEYLDKQWHKVFGSKAKNTTNQLISNTSNGPTIDDNRDNAFIGSSSGSDSGFGGEMTSNQTIATNGKTKPSNFSTFSRITTSFLSKTSKPKTNIRKLRSSEEKMKYLQLIRRHTAFETQTKTDNQQNNSKREEPMLIDLTSSANSLHSDQSLGQSSQQKYRTEPLDTSSQKSIIERCKREGIIAPVQSIAPVRSMSPFYVRLNTSNITPFGGKAYPSLQRFVDNSTPKLFPLRQKSTEVNRSQMKTPEQQKFVSSTALPKALPESSKKFNESIQQKRDILDSNFASDLRNSLEQSSQSRDQQILKYETIFNELKTKTESDLKLSAKFKEPITRSETHYFRPYIAFDDRLEEEEEDEEEDEEEEETSISEFPQLTPDMNREIDAALRPTPPNEVLTEGFSVQICRKDMETLKGLNWLNDEIINFYLSLIVERGKNDNFSTVYAFNTFFYKKLMDNGPQSLKRWTRKVDVFANDFIFIPIHLGMHWCLAVIDFLNKKIEYYDSMGGKNVKCVEALKAWLQTESIDKRKCEFPMTDWSLEMAKDIPQQMNGSDCGMFTCKYAEYISRKAKINFSQAHMPYFRRRMVYEILNKQLL